MRLATGKRTGRAHRQPDRWTMGWMSRALATLLVAAGACSSPEEVDACPERRFAATRYIGSAIVATTLECVGNAAGPCDEVGEPPTLDTWRTEECGATVFSIQNPEGSGQFVRLLFFTADLVGAQVIDSSDDSEDVSIAEPEEVIVEIAEFEETAATGRFDLFFEDGRISGTFDYDANP